MDEPISIHQPIDGDEFIRVVTPSLQACDAAALARDVTLRWRPREVCKLLKHPNVDVRRVAAVTLGMVGDPHTVTCLTHALRDGDEQVNQMAEHALWSIWFRTGSPDASTPFRQGLAHLADDDYDRAATSFRQATQADESFTEAWNQLGIAYYLKGEYRQAMEAYRQAIKRLPMHFGAIAGMGHCFAQLGDLNMALRCYRRARRINPRMDGIAETIERLQTRVVDMSDSGMFEVDHIIAS